MEIKVHVQNGEMWSKFSAWCHNDIILVTCDCLNCVSPQILNAKTFKRLNKPGDADFFFKIPIGVDKSSI